MTHTSEGIATDDSIFARRTTNLRISSTECGENTELTETKREKALRRKNRARSEEGPVVNMLPSPTRVFLTKSAEWIENKRVDFFRGAKECARVWNERNSV